MSLKNTLRPYFNRAALNPGKPYRKELASCLRIDFLTTHTNQMIIQLSAAKPHNPAKIVLSMCLQSLGITNYQQSDFISLADEERNYLQFKLLEVTP